MAYNFPGYDVLITVTVSDGKYQLDGTTQVTASLTKGLTYKFDQSAASNSTHPLVFSSDSSNSSAYTTGVTQVGTPGSANAYTLLETTETTPSELYYYCSNHPGMGGQANLGAIGGSIRDQAGKVGIGLTAAQDPAYKLDVNGDIMVRGGDIRDGSGNPAVTMSGGNVTIPNNLTVTGTLNGLSYPTSDGTSNQVLTTNGSGTLSFTTVSGGSGIASVSADTSPSLGGNLNVAGHSIVSASGGNIAITPDTSGKIVLDGQSWPNAVGTNGYYLQTDGSGNLSWAAVSGGGGGGVSITTATASFDYNNSVWSSLANGNSYTGYSWDTGIDIPANALIVEIQFHTTTAFNNIGGYNLKGPYLDLGNDRVLFFDGWYQGNYGPSQYYGSCMQTAGLSAMKTAYRNGSSSLDLELSIQKSGGSSAPTQGAATITVYYLS
ncbi:MAG: hypothetical protein CMF11_04900 [Idiomarina sp.]|nr:hypothetical protein [Idiomarina sp.]